jgi:hypothetical protein
MLNLDKLSTSTAATIVGSVEFKDIQGRAYIMKEGDRINAGVSFIYQGGKFSAKLDPDTADKINEASKGELINFSSVKMVVTPHSFGREKQGGLKAGLIYELSVSDSLVYQDKLSPFIANGKQPKDAR